MAYQWYIMRFMISMEYSLHGIYYIFFKKIWYQYIHHVPTNSIIHWIGFVGTIDRKPPYFMVKIRVSCRFSHQNPSNESWIAGFPMSRWSPTRSRGQSCQRLALRDRMLLSWWASRRRVNLQRVSKKNAMFTGFEPSKHGIYRNVFFTTM